ncbi:MAG: DMT family transporter [Actinobacteria bacterium]|nr:DMT family transporter [Actinomycetota bacterium]
MQPLPAPDRARATRPGVPAPATALGLLSVTVVLLGVNWPLMKIGLDSVEPVWFAVLRVATAGTVIGGIALLTGRLRLPPRHDWPVVASVGAGGIALNLVLVFTALQFVPAGRSSVLVWTAGLWTVPIAAVALRERMTGRRWAGLIAGIAGIVLLFEPWRFAWSEGDIVVGHGLLIASAVLQAAVIVHTRGHRWETGPTAALPWQMLLGTLLLLGVALVREGAPEIEWSMGFGAIVAYQALLATGFAAWAKQMVTLSLRATTVSLVLMAVPVVGLVSSVIILGETVSGVGIAGVVGIAFGVAVSLLAERAHLSALPPGDRPNR